MAKFIPITPTALSVMQTCPRQFQAKYITKEVVFKETQATIWGNACHKAMEDNIVYDVPIPQEMSFLTPWVERFKAAQGTLMAETELAIDREDNAVPWPNRWLGGRADVVIVNGAKAFIGDLKTGKFRTSPQQLTILTRCLFAAYPKVQVVNAALFYPHLDQIEGFRTTRDTFRASEQHKQLAIELVRYEKILERGEFGPRPSGLCKAHCDVLDCEHNGKNR